MEYGIPYSKVSQEGEGVKAVLKPPFWPR